ncbi:hypothetical protein WJX72_009094 [[Myrmecia] bisecta]|uniref:HTH La-type RNA-binding domain-containing protein n=1 Tax=[Myrmecia] bisecta TaxID=41462 RepID=A0AAW1PYG3_9CHLO
MLQVEFYFSDVNLPTDVFMLKQVQRTPEGWVPLKVLAGFNRMKTLTRDLRLVRAALETSTELELSPDQQRVRRKAPLPEVDRIDVLERSVIADNLPEKPSIDAMNELFGRCGEVVMVRICHRGSGPKSTAQTVKRADLVTSNQTHAIVEFKTVEEAARAVHELTDANNWRSGLRGLCHGAGAAIAQPNSQLREQDDNGGSLLETAQQRALHA